MLRTRALRTAFTLTLALAGCVNRTEIAQNTDAARLPDGASPDSAIDAGIDSSAPDAPDPSGQWARSFGGPGSDLPTDLAMDAAGNVYVAGTLTGPSTFGPTTVPGGSRSAFIASYTSAGAFRWVESLGASSSTIGYRVHVAVQGESVFVATEFNGMASRAEGTLTSAGENDLLIASFTTDGAFRWWSRQGAENEDRLSDLGLDASGNLYVTGYFHERTLIGTDTLIGVRGSGFVASFDESGTSRWSRAPGDGASGPIEGLAVQGDNLVLIGGFGGFGAAPEDFVLAGTTISGEFGGTYIFGLDADNEERFARNASSGGGMEIWQMVTSPAGNTFVAAGLRGFAMLGERPLRPMGTYDAVVMAFDSAGVDIWANVYGSDDIAPIDRATGIAIDVSGGVALTGQFAGAIDLGGGILDPTPFMSGHNTFVLLLGAGGEYVWSTAFDNAAQDGQVSSVVVHDEGHLFVATPFRRDATFGSTMLNSAGAEDGALIRLQPDR